MSATDRLREIDQILPTDEDVFSGDTRNDAYFSLREALPEITTAVWELECLVGMLEDDGCLETPEDLDDAREALAALAKALSPDA